MKKFLRVLAILGLFLLLLIGAAVVVGSIAFLIAFLATMSVKNALGEAFVGSFIGVTTITLTIVLYYQARRYHVTGIIQKMLDENEYHPSSIKELQSHENKMRTHIGTLPHRIRKTLVITLKRYDPEASILKRIEGCKSNSHKSMFNKKIDRLHLDANDCTNPSTGVTYRESIRKELRDALESNEHSLSIRTPDKVYRFKAK